MGTSESNSEQPSYLFTTLLRWWDDGQWDTLGRLSPANQAKLVKALKARDLSKPDRIIQYIGGVSV